MLEIVVGYDEKRLIGNGSELPWHIPDDLKHFKNLTSGNRIIMGRKTYESIGRLLPNRENIILSRTKEYRVDGALVVSDIKELLQILDDNKKNFIIGGAKIYKELLPFTDKLHISHIKGTYKGDVYFPEVNWELFDIVEEVEYKDFVYRQYIRKI
jgi:dihydrofolate reductase